MKQGAGTRVAVALEVIPILGVVEAVAELQADDAPFGGNDLGGFIGDVARRLDDRHQSAVRIDDGIAAGRGHLAHRGIGGVRHVDQHSQPVHLVHHFNGLLLLPPRPAYCSAFRCDHARTKPRAGAQHGRAAAPPVRHRRGADESGTGRSQGRRLGAGDFGQRRHLAFAQPDAGVGVGAARSRHGLGRVEEELAGPPRRDVSRHLVWRVERPRHLQLNAQQTPRCDSRQLIHALLGFPRAQPAFACLLALFGGQADRDRVHGKRHRVAARPAGRIVPVRIATRRRHQIAQWVL